MAASRSPTLAACGEPGLGYPVCSRTRTQRRQAGDAMARGGGAIGGHGAADPAGQRAHVDPDDEPRVRATIRSLRYFKKDTQDLLKADSLNYSLEHLENHG